MNKIKKLWEDKTGVSPIIAVILMVAITVVLAATIYVWVSGFGGGGGGSNIALSLRQVDHGENYVEYEVQSVSGNPGWSDLECTVGGTASSFASSSGGATVSDNEINAGDNIFVTTDGYTGADAIVGEEVTISDTDSGSIIFSATITYA